MLSRLRSACAVHPAGPTPVSDAVAADLGAQARRRARTVAWAGLLVNLPLFVIDDYQMWASGVWAEVPRYGIGLLAWRVTAVASLALYLVLDRRTEHAPQDDARLATGLAVWFLVLGGWFGAFLEINPFALPLYGVTLFVIATLVHPPTRTVAWGYGLAAGVGIVGMRVYGSSEAYVLDTFEGFAVVALLALVVDRAIYRQSYRTAEAARQLERSNGELSRALGRLRETQGRLVAAERQAERAWISRDLHDSVGAQLANLLAGVELVRLQRARDPDAAADMLAAIEADARAAITDLRETIWALQTDTPSLGALGRRLAGFADGMAARAGMAVSVDVGEEAELSPTQALHLYRIGQEAVQNASKHSGARTLAVRLAREGGRLRLAVADDGAFCPAGAPTMAAPSGFGLGNMRARAEALGGTLTLATEQGTTVAVDVPAEPPAPGETLDRRTA